MKQDGGEGYYRTVLSALKNAEMGDRILLMDATHRERLHIDGQKLRLPLNLSVEAAPGVTVTWAAPEKSSDDGDKLLYLTNVRNLHFRNIRFDGADKVDKLISLYGKCPGLTFENITLEGFRITGLTITNCAGEENHPILLQRVTARAKNQPDSAVTFNAFASNQAVPTNEYIRLQDCRFEGEYKKGPINDLTPRSPTVKLINTPE